MFKRVKLSLFLCTCYLFLTANANAANWLMLQGTEPGSTSERAHVWGFIQGQYQQDFSTANQNDRYIPAKLIGPNLTSQNMFNINRARIGVRGTGLPVDSKINYFILAELGNNGITGSLGRVKMTDASVTFNHIPFLRIRAGLFKYPGSEEGLQAIQVFDYINYTTVSNQLMLERFPNDDNFNKTIDTNNTLRGNTEAQALGVAPNGFEKPVGAFRDIGIQLFNSILIDDFDISYAGMIGNGNGLNYGDNNGNKTYYGYLSLEKIFEGEGAKRQGIKVYAWYQTGKRAFDEDFSFSTQQVLDSNGAATSFVNYVSANRFSYVHYTRTRSGLGFKFLKGPFRAAGEYLRGNGMIFLGPHKESFDMNAASAAGGDGLMGTANGWYLDGGWKFLGNKYELDARYDVYNRLTGDPLEAKFTTLTVGAQYFINLKTRISVNYTLIRKATSVNNKPVLSENFDGLGKIFAAQFSTIF